MDEKVYAVTDLNGYVSDMRLVAAQSLSENCEQDNLDHYISLDQMIGIVKQKSVGLDDQNRYLLNEDANEKIFEEVAIWIHNAGLAKLAAMDLIECAWDDESDEMVFWAKTPENQSNVQKDSGRKNKRDKG